MFPAVAVVYLNAFGQLLVLCVFESQSLGLSGKRKQSERHP